MQMKLYAGRTADMGTAVIFNIFDLLPENYAIPVANIKTDTVTVRPTGTTQDVTFNTLYFNVSDATNIYKLFPANIPRKCTDDGNIIMTSGGMYKDMDDTYIKYGQTKHGVFKIPETDTEFTDVSGVQPDNWDNDRYLYYFVYKDITYYPAYHYSNCRTNESTQAGYNDVYNGQPTTFDQTATYKYNSNTDPRKNLFQLYTAETGSSFGVWRNFNSFGTSMCGIGNIWTEFNDSGTNNYGRSTPAFFAPFGVVSSQTYSDKQIYHLNYNEPAAYVYDEEFVNYMYVPITQAKTITIFVSYIYNDKTYYGTAIVTMSGTGEDAYPVAIQAQLFSAEFWGDSIISGGSSGGNWGADTVIAGGNGTFSANSDVHGDKDGHTIRDRVTALNDASMAFTAAGINIYKLDVTSAVNIGNIISVLFTDNFLLKFKNYMYNPLSSILSAHLLPLKLVSNTGASRSVTAGGYNISDAIAALSTAPIANQYTWLHVGDVDIQNFSDSFADYAPYTSAHLHLPYCGVINIDINKIMNGKLAVEYVCDSASGNVAAIVWVNDKDNSYEYVYQATGNAAYTYPMFSENQSGAAVGKLVGAIGNFVLGAAGSPYGLVGGATGLVDAALQRRQTQVSGTFSGNVAAMTWTRCFLEVTRPVWANPHNFQQLIGLMSQLSGTLADNGEGEGYAGFVKVSEVDLDGFEASAEEKQEIERLLKSGIFVIAE